MQNVFNIIVNHPTGHSYLLESDTDWSIISPKFFGNQTLKSLKKLLDYIKDEVIGF